jgi:hypothetical protein
LLLKECEKSLPLFIDLRLRSSNLKDCPRITLSGRKFAEHRGLEDAERIDNDPPFIIFQQKE